MQSLDANGFQLAARALADAARELAQLGWTPATSSNFSVRLDAATAAITISGRDKGRLGVEDFMVVDFAGRAVGSEHRPSAETLLHTQLYAHDPAIGCVLHTHSRTQTVASRLFADRGEIVLAGFELLKAFRGYDTHEAAMRVPVLPNSQDMHALAAMIDPYLKRDLPLHGYLIDGHGIYAWGRDLKEARRHLDAFEFLLACELDLWNLRR
jgi:methylthioribulose-1-phosphate dehydratase